MYKYVRTSYVPQGYDSGSSVGDRKLSARERKNLKIQEENAAKRAARKSTDGEVHDPLGYFSGATTAPISEWKRLYRKQRITLQDSDFQ